MQHFLLFYEVIDNYVERRAEFRQLHLEHAWAAQRRGDLLLAGAVGDPPDGAVLLFQAASPDVAKAFAETDPYVMGGLIKHWYVRPWITVVGTGAASPLTPDAAEPRRLSR